VHDHEGEKHSQHPIANVRSGKLAQPNAAADPGDERDGKCDCNARDERNRQRRITVMQP
jgi:hypothetical protein